MIYIVHIHYFFFPRFFFCFMYEYNYALRLTVESSYGQTKSKKKCRAAFLWAIDRRTKTHHMAKERQSRAGITLLPHLSSRHSFVHHVFFRTFRSFLFHSPILFWVSFPSFSFPLFPFFFFLFCLLFYFVSYFLHYYRLWLLSLLLLLRCFNHFHLFSFFAIHNYSYYCPPFYLFVPSPSLLSVISVLLLLS